jgi:thiol-disulfide isomerase/thioredoxin
VLIGVPEELWRYISGGILVALGILMVFPTLWAKVPGVSALNMESNKLLTSGYQRGGFWGDALMGAALGPVFASCSPTYFIILATVLPATPILGTVYLVAYAAGLSLALLAIALLGEKLVGWLGITLDPNGKFFKSIGVVLVVVGLLVFTGYMKKVETYLVERGFDATFLELKLLGGDEMSVQTDPEAGFIPPERKGAMYKRAIELVAPDGYINTGGGKITLGELKGKKVVLLDIWTYSCINCIRTIPYLRDWYEKYSDEGFEIIGIHTPEFAFEKVRANVEKAVRDYQIRWPVILDNNYQTWTAYGNNYWPRKYLVDIDGYIIYDHIGEGAYAETEAQIQRALHERAIRLGMAFEEMDEPEENETQRTVRSPEVYFGAWRNELLGNGEPGLRGERTFALPTRLSPNTLYFGGKWNIEQEYAINTGAPAQIRFLYGSKDVFMVASADSPVRLRITRDGKPLGAAAGGDVSADGIVTVQEDRLYRLVEDSGYGEHTLEIEVLDIGLKAYTFTFG